ncbi:hypothetical protein WT83_04985 [Burkholderia territorii]|uniref:Uncharacterized protein n=1 Tax=Burkholderia territorii TaxID=1503055 RepID=A0A108F2T0_9BURK|nr:hypothetical protein WT83_04985 [Burkholderia territorii]
MRRAGAQCVLLLLMGDSGLRIAEATRDDERERSRGSGKNLVLLHDEQMATALGHQLLAAW